LLDVGFGVGFRSYDCAREWLMRGIVHGRAAATAFSLRPMLAWIAPLARYASPRSHIKSEAHADPGEQKEGGKQGQRQKQIPPG
jgi:hypothetical protein